MEAKLRFRFITISLVLIIGSVSAGGVREGAFLPVPESNEPPRFEFGTGPATLVGIDYFEPSDANEASWVRLTFDAGAAEIVYHSPEFQLKVFLDSPEHDVVLYHCAEQTLLVTPDFEVLSDYVPSEVDYDRDEIYFFLPFHHEEMSGLAVLAWDWDPFYRHRTVLPFLDYYGFEIGRAGFQQQKKQQRRQQKSEVYVGVSSDQQVNAANNKGWPAGPGDTIPDDGTNPPGNPGPLYKGWPLTFSGGTRFWEYSASSGFLKRVHIDTNGNGKIDPGEPDGYVGRCPYVVGINSQTMTGSSSIWISRWKDHGQRIVHTFQQFIQPDGSTKWQVSSTHETQQPDGTWKKTPVSPLYQNPIVSDPYQNPSGVPGNSAFGL